MNLFKKFVFSSLIFLLLVSVIRIGQVYALEMKLIIGKYDCTTNTDCLEGYCDIDEHVCKKYHVCEVCSECPECICPECPPEKICPECPVLPECPDTWHVLDGICIECVNSSDCSGIKPYCDTVQHICTKDPTKFPIIEDEKCIECINNLHCSGNQVCKEGQCICSDGKIWDITSSTCVCPLYTPIDADPETCMCPEGMEVVNGKCVEKCPNVVGMTGYRDKYGQCLCDDTQGYVKISVDNTFCNCDVANNWFNKPDNSGKCITCVQTTKQWSIDTRGGLVDNDSMDEEVWFCAYNRINENNRREFYNPTTGDYCSYKQILKKNASGKFYCANCSGDRATGFGYCGCLNGTTWDASKAVCTGGCTGGLKYVDGSCSKCGASEWTVDGVNCKGPSCDGTTTSWIAGGKYFYYNLWKKVTPVECHSTTGRSLQANSGACDYRKGCQVYEGREISCNWLSVITSDCTCPTGGNEGEYCCPLAQIVTSDGCKFCEDGQVPSSDRKTCITCSKEGKIPNSAKTECVCADGYQFDSEKKTCVSIN